MFDLSGKNALVTGAASGIGEATARTLAAAGAKVYVADLDFSRGIGVADEISKEGFAAEFMELDVSVKSSCDAAEVYIRRTDGWLDILVNNAAFQKHQKAIEDISDEQFEETFRTNIFGYFYMAKAALKHIPEGGSIINCGSITGFEGSKELIDYSATKGAIHAFTKSLAQSLVERKIRVNCVSPGPVWTPLNVADKEPEEVAKHGADTPMKRPGQPEEIAPAFVFFASNVDSSYISGEVMTILGGETRAG